MPSLGRNLKSYAAFTPAQQVARNMLLVARNKLRVALNLLRATSCAGVNAASESIEI